MTNDLQSAPNRTKAGVPFEKDGPAHRVVVESTYFRTGQASATNRATNRRWLRIAYILIDLMSVSSSGLIAIWIRFLPKSSDGGFHFYHNTRALPADFSVSRYAAFLLLYAALVLLFCQGQDLYRTVRTRTAFSESLAVLKAVCFTALVFAAFIYLSGVRGLSRTVVSLSVALTGIALISWRLGKRKLVMSRLARGIGTRNTLIVGAGRVGTALARHLEENKSLGFHFVGFLDSNHHNEPKLIGKIEDLPHVARSQFIDEVFITIPSERELVKSIALEAQRRRVNVNVIPDLYDGIGWEAPIHYLGKFPVMELHWEPIPAVGLFAKRLIDVVISGVGLVCSAPLLIIVGLAVRLDSPGAALYRSLRVGQKGRKFVCYKFRTMERNADALKDQLRHLNERAGPTFKIAKDPRITRIGKVLRKYSLDELPQLWNVLRGEMSLVGPRPHPIDDYKQYSLEDLRRLTVRPGITGLWQITARDDPSFATNMKLDLEYIENWHIRLDMRILLKTFHAVFKGSGA